MAWNWERMLTGKRFVIYGLSRLSVRVSASLAADHATVLVLAQPSADEALRAALDSAVKVVDTTQATLPDQLTTLNLAGVDCALTLADDDLDNLRVAVLLRRALPDLPVVARAFDPLLADQLESGLKVRRAFSVSALAAPAFATAAAGHTVLETLRIGDNEAPAVRMTLAAGCPLVGTLLADVKARHRCAVLAHRPAGGNWSPVAHHVTGLVVGDVIKFAVGDELLIGGLLQDVLRLCVANSPLSAPSRSFPKPQVRSGRNGMRGFRRPTLLPVMAAVLAAFLISSVFVFSSALRLRLVDAIYFMITTATTTGYGDISLKDSPDWLKLFGGLVMIAGGALLGIVFSQLAAVATTDRLEEVMGRKASRMRGHVIVTGLGNLGYRIAKLLRDVGLPVVVLEIKPNARFAAAVQARCPVLTGDARLPEDLVRAGVASCAAVIACTNDDLANIQACLNARRVNPQARIVVRAFDENLADRLSGAFDIDAALSSSVVAAKAFVGAAGDERAFRTIHLTDDARGSAPLDFLACRHTLTEAATTEMIDSWRARGVRILAWRRPGGPVEPPLPVFPALQLGSELALCGPPDELRKITDPSPSAHVMDGMPTDPVETAV